MANLMVICGPQAVGKMTVAESVQNKTDYKLMTNHDSIEVSGKIFGFSTAAQKELNAIIREKVFELAIKHDINLIFTYVCNFDDAKEKAYLKSLSDMFESSGGLFYFIELNSDIQTRLQRNKTPHRMEMKPSKRDIQWSESNLLHDAQMYRLNSHEDEYWFKNHIKIDNTKLPPDVVANMIIDSCFGEPK